MNTYKISVPKPCHEDWNKMTPNDKGRFCDNCSKTVVDFSKMTDTEIKNYLIAQKGKSVCGHFRTAQLQRITITIPSQVLFSQTQFRKIFLLALLFTMGTTLLSCSDQAGNKQKIENVVIEEDEVIASEDIDTLEHIFPLSPPSQKGEFLDGEVKYEPDSIPKCKTIKQVPMAMTGVVIVEEKEKPVISVPDEVVLELEEEDSHIQGDTIITPPQ